MRLSVDLNYGLVPKIPIIEGGRPRRSQRYDFEYPGREDIPLVRLMNSLRADLMEDRLTLVKKEALVYTDYAPNRDRWFATIYVAVIDEEGIGNR